MKKLLRQNPNQRGDAALRRALRVAHWLSYVKYVIAPNLTSSVILAFLRHTYLVTDRACPRPSPLDFTPAPMRDRHAGLHLDNLVDKTTFPATASTNPRARRRGNFVNFRWQRRFA